MPRRKNTIILHISDMHFGIPEGRQPTPNRERMLRSFIDCVSNLSAINKPDIIVISGDIGWSGASGDYEKAKRFFETFFRDTDIQSSQVIVCFGNHDVYASPYMVPDVEGSGETFLAYDKHLGAHVKRPPKDTSEFQITNVESFFHRFENIENFCNDMAFNVLRNPSTGTRKFRRAYGVCSCKGIDFICLNTEWDFWGCNDKQSNEHLRIGQNLYNETINTLGTFYPFTVGTPARFVIFHRSLNQIYIPPYNNGLKGLGDLIHENDVTLNGHDHVQHIEKFGPHTRIFAGTIHSTDVEKFSFNLITIPKKLKSGRNKCKVSKYSYSESNTTPCWNINGNPETFYIVRTAHGSRIPQLLSKYSCHNDDNLDINMIPEEEISNLSEDDRRNLDKYLNQEEALVMIREDSKKRTIEEALRVKRKIEKNTKCLLDDTGQSVVENNLEKTLTLSDNVPTSDGYVPLIKIEKTENNRR